MENRTPLRSELDKDFYAHQKSLMSLALRLADDQQQACDLFQETAYRIFKHQEKYERGTNFKGWAYTIMKNTFINEYRRRRRQKAILTNIINQHYMNMRDLHAQNEGEARLGLEPVYLAISQLSESNRLAFLLHHKGYKYEEIAERYKLPIGTVKSRIFLAKKQLRKCLSNQ